MIEVEKKFRISDEQRARILDGAKFEYEKTMHDVYYDGEGYPLSRKDWWLRKRNGTYELKVAVHALGLKGRGVDQYREHEQDHEIVKALRMEEGILSDEVLARAGYRPLIDITTLRRSYTRSGFTVVLDEADFGYTICEIEKMAPEGSDLESVGAEILAFAASQGLEMGLVYGKVLEYIHRFLPDCFQSMEQAGVIGS